MKIEQHCAACLEKLGQEFREVHEWLDWFDGKAGRDQQGEYDYTRNRIKHRERRHHIEGIQQCAELFGPKAAQAASIHIEQDFFGYVPQRGDYYRKEFWDEMAERAPK